MSAFSHSVSSSKSYTPCLTPQCVLNIDIVTQNANKMLQIVEWDLGLLFYLYFKIHKQIKGALIQTGGHHSKVVVRTLPKIQLYTTKGFTYILYVVQLAGLHKIRFIWKNFNLQYKDVKCVINHPEQLQMIKQWMKENVVEKDDDDNINKKCKNKWQILFMLGVWNKLSTNNVLMHQVGLDPTYLLELEEAVKNLEYVSFQEL